MKIINGAYSSAHIFTTTNETTAIDPYAVAQIQMICDHESSLGSTIRVMPDVHPGKVGTIVVPGISELTRHCQHCDKYCPRARVRHINKKKQYNLRERSNYLAVY